MAEVGNKQELEKQGVRELRRENEEGGNHKRTKKLRRKEVEKV